MSLRVAKAGDAKYERVNVVVTAIRDALRDKTLAVDDVILALANMLGDAMAQKFGDEACNEHLLNAVFDVVHGAIHNSTGKEPLGQDGSAEEHKVALDRKHFH